MPPQPPIFYATSSFCPFLLSSSSLNVLRIFCFQFIYPPTEEKITNKINAWNHRNMYEHFENMNWNRFLERPEYKSYSALSSEHTQKLFGTFSNIVQALICFRSIRWSGLLLFTLYFNLFIVTTIVGNPIIYQWNYTLIFSIKSLNISINILVLTVGTLTTLLLKATVFII